MSGRLQKLLKEHMKTVISLFRGSIVYCEGEISTNLSTGITSTDFGFKQLEADTMLLSACAKLLNGKNDEVVVIDSEDTDVYVQAAYASHKLKGHLLIKRKNEHISCSAMVSKDVSNIIIPLHIITGSDHTSGFYGHGKKKLLQKVISDPEARKLLERVGESLVLRDEVKQAMKTFVICVIYKESTGLTCGQARASRWHNMKKKKKSTLRLPPDDDTLKHHLERTNYLSYCQIHYDLLEHPSPIGRGWEFINGKCRVVRYTKPPLPHQLKRQDEIDGDSDSSTDDEDDSTDSDD